MKAIVVGGKLTVDIYEIIESLADEERRQFADSVACNSDVIKFVTQQILDGWTELDSHGPIGMATPEPYHGLEWAIRQVALRAGDVASKEVQRLQSALEMVENQRDRLAEDLRRINDKRDSVFN